MLYGDRLVVGPLKRARAREVVLEVDARAADDDDDDEAAAGTPAAADLEDLAQN